MLASVFPSLTRIDVTLQPREVNGQPGAIFRDRDNQVLAALTLDILDGQIQMIRSASTPTSSGISVRSQTPARSPARRTRPALPAAWPGSDWFRPMELLRTDRLLLRHWDDCDLAAFFDLYSRDDVVRWLGAHPRRPLATTDEAEGAPASLA